MPNECWQSDFTHYPLLTALTPEIITWLDDCTRMALHVSVHQRITATTVTTTFRDTVENYGVPGSTLTDNGMVYTVRLAAEGRHGGRTSFENELRRLHITQKNSRPNHPTTCGKVERFQQTLKSGRAQPDQPTTLTELQTLINNLPTTTTTTDPTDHYPTKQPQPPHPTAQSHTRHRPNQRHPPPNPPRHHRHRRKTHLAPQRTPPPHRYRTNPRPNPHHHDHPRPEHPRHQRHNRRNPSRTNPRHHKGLPTLKIKNPRT